MKQNENKEIKSEVQLLYEKIVVDVQYGKVVVPNDLKGAFGELGTLSETEQVKLINKLSKSNSLPEVIRDFIELIQFKQAPFLDEVPEEIPKTIIATFEDDKTLSALALTSKEGNRLFKTDRLFTKFVQQVAYGGQDKVEGLFTLLEKQKRDKAIQELLCKMGVFTDYSGRKYHCSAYEYAYWAKDRHMCRMLERHMDEDTKAMTLKRCEAIEKNGLKYTQNGKEYCTKHFDLTPLETALKEYVDGYDNWDNTESLGAMKAGWMKIGLEQRDVPAHVIHEYCRRDRSFNPTSTFNEDTLPRGSKFYNFTTLQDEQLLPLVITKDSGLGVNFSLFRMPRRAAGSPIGLDVSRMAGTRVRFALDLLAISRLDEVRTEDLKQSLDNLRPKEPGHKLGH